MKIELTNVGKRFNEEWIFRKADLQFEAGNSYAITGPNGSGKSTLLQIIGGLQQASVGSVSYTTGGSIIPTERAFRHISFAAPYLEVIEEFTLTEFLRFHVQFKGILAGVDVKNIIKEVELESAADKQIRYFSSGMKQRVKLAQAIFSNTSLVLLDEPCSNLDVAGIELYHSLIQRHCKDRIVIVCSNDPVEYSFCQKVISITDFKS